MQAFDYLPYRLTGRPVAIRPLPGAGPWAAAKLAAADLDPGRFPDATLAAIAQTRPANRSELSGISGVGAAKLERYGEAVLEVVAGA